MASYSRIEEIQKKWSAERKKAKFEYVRKSNLESRNEYERIEDRYYDLLKNSTILSGSVFASSIAFASGRNVGFFFIIGELMLLLSTLFGIIFLWNQLNVGEWSYFLRTKGRLESELLLYEDVMEDYEVKLMKQQIASYKDLLEKKYILRNLFTFIKPDWLPVLFYQTLILGLVAIWISLLMP